jgi:hypothetical protein
VTSPTPDPTPTLPQTKGQGGRAGAGGEGKKKGRGKKLTTILKPIIWIQFFAIPMSVMTRPQRICVYQFSVLLMGGWKRRRRRSDFDQL